MSLRPRDRKQRKSFHFLRYGWNMAAVLSLLSLSRPRVHGVRSSTLASMCTKSLCGGGGRHLQHTHYIRLEIRICDRRGPGWRSGRNLEKMARQGGVASLWEGTETVGGPLLGQPHSCVHTLPVFEVEYFLRPCTQKSPLLIFAYAE